MRNLIKLSMLLAIISIAIITCKKKDVEVTGVTVSPATVTLQPSGTQQFTAAVLPTDATDKSVTWNSDNSARATVSASGMVTIPAGATAGTVAITATSKNGKSGSATVTVTIPEPPAPVITITTDPAEATSVTEGEISGNLTVAASVTQGATLTYLWHTATNTSHAGAAAIVGATTASFTIPTTLEAGTYYYFCEVSATGAESKRSKVATVTVSAPEVVIPDIELTIAAGTYTYNGSAQQPSVTVKADGETLTAGTDYTLAYSDNTNAGTATVTATGAGTYAGKSDAKTFTIAKFDITVTADDAERTFWNDDPAEFTFDVTPALFGSDALTGTLKRTAGTAVGFYDIIEDTPFANSNYEITFVKGEFEIYYFRGDGLSANTAYQIGTAAQLAGLAGFVNTIATNSVWGDKYYKLTDNINLNNAAWNPIGRNNPSMSFRGHFDGNGKIVSGLFISGGDYIGLFGCISGGTVQKLGVNGSVSGANSYLGGVVGWLVNGSITNCYSSVEVSIGYFSGGLAGEVTGSSIITNCYATGVVSGSANRYVGGLVGNFGSGAIITNCYATSAVSGSTEVGGVAGQNWGGSLINCAAFNPNVTGVGSVGRVVGYTWGGANTNNVAWSDMTLPVDATGIIGADIDKAATKTQATYEALGWQFGDNDDNPWKMGVGDYELPVFYWQTTAPAEMPTHLE